jgi:nitrilase
MQHIAKEGRCFVISVNQFCKVSDFPADYPPFTPEHHDRQPDGSPWTPDAILNHGGSCIVGPLGLFVEGAEPVWDKEHIVYAELNRDDLVEARVIFQHSPAQLNLLTYYRWTSTQSAVIPGQIYCEW